MAGAVEMPCFELWHNSTGQMTAFLPVGDERSIVQSDEQAAFVFGGIIELDDAPEGNLVESRNALFRPGPELTELAAGRDPALSGDKGAAGQNEEFCELPAGHRVVFGNIGRKIEPPLGLLIGRPAVRVLATELAAGKTHGGSP
jgi:hypothetical protein